MARAVVCAVTGERGTSDSFVKVGSKYYMSQKVYDDDRRKKDLHREIVDTVCFELLGYTKGQVFPTMLPKKLKELEFYDNEVILQTIKHCASDIQYWLSHKQFDSDNGKVAYLFAIVKGQINDEYAAWKRVNTQREKPVIAPEKDEILEINRPAARGKNITNWLEDDEK